MLQFRLEGECYLVLQGGYSIKKVEKAKLTIFRQRQSTFIIN